MNEKYYSALEAYYTDKSGKLSYDLLNKDLIKFAHSSSYVRAMITNRESVETIRNYVLVMKFRHILGDKNLTEEIALELAGMLDDAYSKGAFKAFNDEIRKKQNANKKK